MTFSGLLQLASERLGVEIEDAGGAAGVAIDGAPVVLQDAGGLLLLRAELGTIPAKGREAVLAAAMEANWLYQGTGGATLAINPRNGHLHIQKYNWLERLDPDKALDTLSRFADTSLKWQKLLSDYSSLNDEASEEAQPEDVAAFGEFMKV